MSSENNVQDSSNLLHNKSVLNYSTVPSPTIRKDFSVQTECISPVEQINYLSRIHNLEGRRNEYPLKIPRVSRSDDLHTPVILPPDVKEIPPCPPPHLDSIPVSPHLHLSGGFPPRSLTMEGKEIDIETCPPPDQNETSRSDIEEDLDQRPADLSNGKDERGVAHGVFGTGTGKTLPEMIQSGRNAGLPLYVRCPICQKEFKQKSTLLQHGCIHIESRPYPCGECGKRFRQQSHLTQHLRIHTNEKPYGCLYCGRNFRQRTILNQHVRIHTGEKPYKCAQCGKDFRQKAILDQHTRTHQGDRPYCCPLPNCRRRFATESEVKRHVENHVGPKRKTPQVSPGVAMNPSPLVKPELYLPQCYPHPGNFQQQYAMSQLLGSSPPQPTALVQ